MPFISTLERDVIYPHATYLDYIDPDFALQQAKWIRKHFDPYPLSTAYDKKAGRFYSNYKNYFFHKTSSIPLIQQYVKILTRHKDVFEKLYNRPMQIDWVYLAYTEDSSKEMGTNHYDSEVFWDGQFHCTIQGNANIVMYDNTLENLITCKNGTIWYLNATEYIHKIKPSHGERFELNVPNNLNPKIIKLRNEMIGVHGQLDHTHRNAKILHRWSKQVISQKHTEDGPVAEQ
jgi:hypothetical protein|tara:strand:- start:1262 stop:1957 length:696 start_codon:yes stop_codon:yes gene_type:complete